MLDGPKREIAEGVANDEYVFWLGSGISRERLPDLRDVAKRVLVMLQARIDQSAPACRFKQALEGVVTLANTSPDERGRLAFAQPADRWLDTESLAACTGCHAARMLDGAAAGEATDYLVRWGLEVS